ncbi:MAG: DUF2059 domain-containing protein [Thiobacillaceae bacterium]
MNLLKTFLFVFSLFMCSLSFADDGARHAAETLLNTIGIEDLLEQTMSQSLDSQLAEKPELVPYKQVMLTFLRKHMSYESLKPDLINLYAAAFTAQELQELNEFYKTPIGKKALQKMPELINKGAQLGSRRVQDNIQELQEMLQAESERIQKLEAK